MKIYRLQTIWPCLPLAAAKFKVTLHAGSRIEPLPHEEYMPRYFRVVVRREFLRDHHIDGKTLARLLPAWAKPKKLPSMGAKVTAFYAENNKVICYRSAIVVGSDEWHELQETLPDPFRATRRYMVEKYGRAYA